LKQVIKVLLVACLLANMLGILANCQIGQINQIFPAFLLVFTLVFGIIPGILSDLCTKFYLSLTELVSESIRLIIWGTGQKVFDLNFTVAFHLGQS